MAKLIERSSLGSAEAKRTRARVPIATGRAIARSAMTGQYKRSSSSNRQG